MLKPEKNYKKLFLGEEEIAKLNIWRIGDKIGDKK
jgi:hypothetical protein